MKTKSLTTHTIRRIGLALVVALCTSGCLQSKDHLRLNADGSGRWSYRITLGPQMAAMLASDDADSPDTMTAVGVRKAAKETKGVTLRICEEKREGASQVLTVDLTFDSIADLANGPFAEQLGWELKSEGGQLVVYSPYGPFGDEHVEGVSMDISGMKPLLVGFEMARKITLPNPVLETNGRKQETHAAVWSFAVKADTGKEDLQKMGEMRPRVACAMTGVTMKLPVELVIPEDADEDDEEETFGGNYVDTPATQTAQGISLQPIHATVRRDLHYVPTDILAMGSPLRLAFDCTWPEDISPSGYSNLTVAVATDNNGTNLKNGNSLRLSKAKGVRELKIHHEVANRARFEFDLELPARDATAFSVSGHFMLHVPKGVMPVKIEDPKALVGKPVEHPALTDSAVTLRRFQGSIVELSSENVLGAITEIRLSNADGSKVAKPFSTSTRRFAGKHVKSVSFSGISKLDNPVLTLMVAEDVEKQRVDFTFTDLKLP